MVVEDRIFVIDFSRDWSSVCLTNFSIVRYFEYEGVVA